MSGTLNKGSLVKSSGGSGGGGSASFPIIVTDSGSSLPVDLTGYNEGDTFLNTSDKKIYKTEVNGYVANTNTNLTVTVDYTTGIASGFASGLYCSRTGLTNLWYGNNETHHSIKFKVSNVQATPVIRFVASLGSGVNDHSLFYISNDGKIHHSRYDSAYGSYSVSFDNQILDTNVTANTTYVLNITKTGTNCVAQLTSEDGTILEEKNFTTTNLEVSTTSVFYGLGYIINSTVNSSNLSVYLGQSAGELVIPNTSTLSWDSGTDLTEGQYADKTNGALYLYENTELVKIGGNLTKKVYTISADNTSTLDVSSDFTKVVDVLKNGVEIALTDDYTISSGVITFVTALSTTDKITVKGE